MASLGYFKKGSKTIPNTENNSGGSGGGGGIPIIDTDNTGIEYEGVHYDSVYVRETVDGSWGKVPFDESIIVVGDVNIFYIIKSSSGWYTTFVPDKSISQVVAYGDTTIVDNPNGNALYLTNDKIILSIVSTENKTIYVIPSTATFARNADK